MTTSAAPPAPPLPPNPRVGTFAALKVKNYRFYLCSGFFQAGAMNMQMLANGWFAYNLTGSTAVLGLALLAQAIPQTALSFVGGVVSDRIPRRLLMMMVFGINAALALWIAISAQLEIIQWRDLVFRSFIFGCSLAFLMPSRQGIIGELVGRDRIMSAVSINGAMQSVMQGVGPAISGFIIAWVSIEGAYYVIVGSFLMAGVCMLPVKYVVRKVVTKADLSGFVGNMREGLRYARGNRDIFMVLLITFFVVSFAMPYNALPPVFAEDVLHVGPKKLGLLASLSGVGAFIGALTINWLGSGRRGLLFIQAAFLTGAGLVAFCFSTSYAISSIIVISIGMGQALRMTLGNVLIQTYSEDAYVGRIAQPADDGDGPHEPRRLRRRFDRGSNWRALGGWSHIGASARHSDGCLLLLAEDA